MGLGSLIKWKTDMAKKGRQVKTSSSISSVGCCGVGKKHEAVRGNLKSDSDDDDDAQNKIFLICESAFYSTSF